MFEHKQASQKALDLTRALLVQDRHLPRAQEHLGLAELVARARLDAAALQDGQGDVPGGRGV
jgi:hypothetical protein